jgi:hypothetical protein
MISVRVVLQTVKLVLIKYIDLTLDISKEQKNFVQLFNAEWNFVEKIDWNEKPSIPLQFISPFLDTRLLSIPSELKLVLTENETTINDIRLFLLYRKLFLSFNLHENSKILKDFEFNQHPELSFDTIYKISDKQFSSKGKMRVKIREKRGTFPRVLIKDERFVILLALEESGPECYKVDCIENFAKLVAKETNEPKVMVLVSDRNKTFDIIFDDTMEWLSFKNFFEKTLKNVKRKELESLQQLIEEHKALILSYNS